MIATCFTKVEMKFNTSTSRNHSMVGSNLVPRVLSPLPCPPPLWETRESIQDWFTHRCIALWWCAKLYTLLRNHNRNAVRLATRSLQARSLGGNQSFIHVGCAIHLWFYNLVTCVSKRFVLAEITFPQNSSATQAKGRPEFFLSRACSCTAKPIPQNRTPADILHLKLGNHERNICHCPTMRSERFEEIIPLSR